MMQNSISFFSSQGVVYAVKVITPMTLLFEYLGCC